MSRTGFFATLRQDIGRTYRYQWGGRWRRAAASLGTLGVQAVVVHRFGQWARLQPLLLRRLLDPIYWVCSTLIRVAWGIALPLSARIGPGPYIGHFGGIIISGSAVIGRNCNLSHGITIGISRRSFRVISYAGNRSASCTLERKSANR